ncbi:hypothetical protein KIW84_073133 [Lathyrus oleraceus]|uniref:cellulase n=1 Tax=Pisum sativum TaxID=3888 RepID=A0A9D4VQ24_PEA|nr:hypothetical protein KIW84_073133 [Pisum sativum]
MDVVRTAYYVSSKNSGSDVAAEIAIASMVFRKVDPSYSKLLLRTAQKVYQFALQYQETMLRFLHDGKTIMLFSCSKLSALKELIAVLDVYQDDSERRATTGEKIQKKNSYSPDCLQRLIHKHITTCYETRKFSSRKRKSLKPKLPCIIEENENVDEIAGTFQQGIGPERMNETITRGPPAMMPPQAGFGYPHQFVPRMKSLI